MTDRDMVRSWVCIDSNGRDDIAGSVHRDGQPPEPFRGWLELVALLTAERLRPGD
jgi:hypothetical protein